MALLAVDDIFQCNFLPDAFSGTGGHAAAGSGLRDAVRRLENGGPDRRLRLRAVATIAPVQRGPVHPQRTAGAGETVGRSRHAGVDAAVAGALSHLRDATGRRIGTSGRILCDMDAMMQRGPDDRKRSNRSLLKRLLAVVVVMFGFGFA